MSKVKTHRGAAKRMKLAKGGVKRRGVNRAHIATKKTTKRKRNLRNHKTYVGTADAPAAKRLLIGR